MFARQTLNCLGIRQGLRGALLVLSVTTVAQVGSAARGQEPGDHQARWERDGSSTPGRYSDLPSLRQWVEAEGFGQGLQWTAISAVAFRPLEPYSSPTVDPQTGTINQNNSNFWQLFGAPLLLPNGSVIEGLCMLSDDLDNNGQVALSLHVAEFEPQPEELPISAQVLSGLAEQPGWSTPCVFPLGIPYRSFADLNDTGTVGDVTYFLLAQMTNGNTPKRFGGAVVLWRRTVSPPPGEATFGDVPPSHLFFRAIEALAASGITFGCEGGDNFCPNDPLTRGQMASFLATALGLHWPN